MSVVIEAINEIIEVVEVNQRGLQGPQGPQGVSGTTDYNALINKPTSFPSTWSDVSSKPSTFTPSAHTHATSDIISGVIDPARLGTGTPSASNFLCGDGTWKTVNSLAIGNAVSGATAKSVLFADGSSNLGQAANKFMYNTATDQLEFRGTNSTGILLRDNYYSPKVRFHTGFEEFTLGTDYNRMLFEAAAGKYFVYSTAGFYPYIVAVQPYAYSVNASPNNWRMKIASGVAGATPLALQKHASQSVNLLTFYDSDETTVLGAFGKNSEWIPPSIVDSSAPNNSVYYSTTQAKLVYKNSAGTVNVLY